MSGGSFNYAYARVDEFADILDDVIRTKEDMSVEASEELKNIATQARYMAKVMKEVEWFCSYDSGEETFLENLAELQDNFLSED